MPSPAPVKPGTLRAEQIILFRIGEQLFALSSSSVQEVRGADSLSGGASEVTTPGVGKVRQFVRRGPNLLFLVSGARHFGLPAEEGILAFVLRNTDRKSTRLNSSHGYISYAVFCLKQRT